MSTAETRPQRSRVGDDCDRCHYCDLRFARLRHEHDHAPVPQVSGGVDVVAACLTCHEMKDRAGLPGLPADEACVAYAGLVERGLLGGALLGAPPVSWPSEWPTMTRYERIMWARLVALAHQSDVPTDIAWNVLALTP